MGLQAVRNGPGGPFLTGDHSAWNTGVARCGMFTAAPSGLPSSPVSVGTFPLRYIRSQTSVS